MHEGEGSKTVHNLRMIFVKKNVLKGAVYSVNLQLQLKP